MTFSTEEAVRETLIAGRSRPTAEPCHYGVPRARCHVGCGIQCRPARRAAAAHPNCGTADCCRSCPTA